MTELEIFVILFRDVDQVHDMMDDIAEQQDVAREISDAISNPVAFGTKKKTLITPQRKQNFHFYKSNFRS